MKEYPGFSYPFSHFCQYIQWTFVLRYKYYFFFHDEILLKLKEKCENIEKDYSIKLKEEIRKVENKYEDEIYQLEKENSFLRKVINTFQKTVDKFIHWVCNKFSVSSEEEFIRDFEFENDIYLDPEKQIEYEEEQEYEEFEI